MREGKTKATVAHHVLPHTSHDPRQRLPTHVASCHFLLRSPVSWSATVTEVIHCTDVPDQHPNSQSSPKRVRDSPGQAAVLHAKYILFLKSSASPAQISAPLKLTTPPPAPAACHVALVRRLCVSPPGNSLPQILPIVNVPSIRSCGLHLAAAVSHHDLVSWSETQISSRSRQKPCTNQNILSSESSGFDTISVHFEGIQAPSKARRNSSSSSHALIRLSSGCAFRLCRREETQAEQAPFAAYHILPGRVGSDT